MNWLCTAVWLLAMLLPNAASAQAPQSTATTVTTATTAVTATPLVEQPRAFGRVLGDVLTQRVLLEDAGRALHPVNLPLADRVNLWLERWPLRIEADAQGRHWLAVDYQLVSAPTAFTTVALPALTIQTTQGVALSLPEWPISIGPLSPVFAKDDLHILRPDRPVAAVPTQEAVQQLKFALGALLATLAMWLIWWAWRNQHEARQLPFARAWHALQRLDNAASSDAWRLLHHAVNASAGRMVHGANLAALLTDMPQLAPLHAQLTAFYQASSARFFARDVVGDAGDVGTVGAASISKNTSTSDYCLVSLCKALRDMERRHRS